jgi:hypothetical protein
MLSLQHVIILYLMAERIIEIASVFNDCVIYVLVLRMQYLAKECTLFLDEDPVSMFQFTTFKLIHMNCRYFCSVCNIHIAYCIVCE